MPVPEDNVPGPGQVVLDHVGLFVPDMARAARAFERLGFRLTAFSPQRHRLTAGEPLVPAGTANRLALLSKGYVEILTPIAETPVARQLREAIGRYPGLHLIAFGTGDAEASHAHLVGSGFGPAPVIRLERPVETPGGHGIALFSVVRVPPGAMPEGRIQFCRHHTPELVWQKQLVAQPNRARALTDALLCVRDPAEAAWRFGRFVGRAARRSAAGGWLLELDRGRLAFVDQRRPTRLLPGSALPSPPFMAACALTSDDLDATRSVLEASGLEPRDAAPGVIACQLPEGLAATFCFSGPDAVPPWLA
jgi:hypothetical protein